MRFQLATTAMIGLMSVSGAMAQAPGPMAQAGKSMGNRPECIALFKKLDRNGDSNLNDAEQHGAALPSNLLKQPNGDVSEVDYVTACSSQTPL